MTRSVSVIGSGVVGLSIAHELARAGHAVTVISDQPWEQTCSATAGAIWFPFEVDGGVGTEQMLRSTLERFEIIHDEHGEAGVDLRPGTVVERSTVVDREWTRVVPRWRETSLVPPGTTGVRATVPVITMSAYLPWLRAATEARGVRFEARTIGDLGAAEVAGAIVVIAAGLRSTQLIDDELPVDPVRGQVVRIDNSGRDGVQEWLLDDQNPAGLTYVIPRRDCLVLGGTADAGLTDLIPDAAVERGIIDRCADYFPQIRGREVVSRGVGLRPRRPIVRIDATTVDGRRVISAYGHGGAGVTLSWGTAEHVLTLM
jgi:D-amino-acid oxidase